MVKYLKKAWQPRGVEAHGIAGEGSSFARLEGGGFRIRCGALGRPAGAQGLALEELME